MCCKRNDLLVLQSSDNDTGMYIELFCIISNRISRKVSLSDYLIFLCLRQ